MKSPSVAVVIPCFNAAAFLRETLDSALAQTRRPDEIIVIDDGSTDDSAAIAESYGDPVRVIRQANAGESVAMNVGVAATSAENLVFLGADDVLAPSLLEMQLRSLQGRRDAVACTGFAFFTDSIKNAFNVTMPSVESFFPGIIASNLAPASCWMTPRELIIQAGGYHTTQQYFEDWDLWWRVGLTGAAYIPVHMVGFYYRQHVRSQLATLAAAERAYGHAWLMERMCREFLDRDDLLAEFGDTLFWSSMSALRAARSCGVPWKRLRFLCHMIDELIARRPAPLESSTLASLMRTVGVQRLEAIRTTLTGKGAAPSYRPPWLAAQSMP